jgi:hypothetical protein
MQNRKGICLYLIIGKYLKLNMNTLKFGTTEKEDILLWIMQLLKNLIIE